MEWNLKASTTSPWDFSEMEQQQQQHHNHQQQQQQQQETFSSAVNSMVNGGRSAMALFGAGRSDDQDFSVDLKLGNRTAAAKASKRSRGSSNGGGQAVASCLVDGCTADLSECRDYHRKHKVCEIHSKSPKVTIANQTQRFCQQCSRFHGLEEFDEGKRSCRKRLDGHNRRRRKPQSEPFPHYSSLLSNYQAGNQMVPLAAYPPSSAGPGWPNISAVKTEPEIPFPLFHQAGPPEIVPHQFSRAFPLSPEADRPRFSALYDKSAASLSSESALSLLSSSQMTTPLSEMGRRNDMSFSMEAMSSSSSSMEFHHHHHRHHHHHLLHLGSDNGTGNVDSHPNSSSFPSHWGHV